MKKIAIVSFVLLGAMLLVSCNKSGVYKPKDKLSKVWYEREAVTTIDSVDHPSSIDKYLKEDWIWDGKYVASRTVYRTNGDVWYNYKYEYNDNHKVVGITSDISSERKTRIRFIYDDDSKMLKEIKYFTEDFPENSLPYKKLEFTYDGKKITSVKETTNTNRYPRSFADAEISLLPYLVSEDMAESIASNEIRPKVEYDVVVRDYTFEWNKKNISKVTIISTPGDTVNISYTYDEKRNPQLARIMGFVEEGSLDCSVCSKNNIVSCTYESSTLTYTEESEYSYDKKTPTEKIVTRRENGATYSRVITEKWSFEYEE